MSPRDGKLSGMLWWIDRWRSSTVFTDLTLKQQGAYRNLLDEFYFAGPLRNDDRSLARACGDPRVWFRIRAAVLARFELREDGWHPIDNFVEKRVTEWASRPSVRRPDLPSWVRRFVLRRDGACRFCGSTDLPEIDHILRKRDGGPDTPDNLRVLCRPCNRRRG